MNGPDDAEATLRVLLHDAYPSAVARLALELRALPDDAEVMIAGPGVGIGCRAGDLRLVVAGELESRFAKSAEGRGKGT